MAGATAGPDMRDLIMPVLVWVIKAARILCLV
jgi:hypothetical protein